MHNTTVSDAMVEAAIDAWENVYEAELQLGSLAYTDNKEVAMRAAIDAALAPSVVKPCEVKALEDEMVEATDETLLMMVGTYNRITGYAFPQASHAEQLEAMRAILSCLSHPAPEGVVEALTALRIDRDNEAERKLRARRDKDTTMIAVHAYAEGVLAGHVKSFEGALSHPAQGWEPEGFTPYLWQCKDYADSWISYANKDGALAYQRDTGCLLRITYRPTAPAGGSGNE